MIRTPPALRVVGIVVLSWALASHAGAADEREERLDRLLASSGVDAMIDSFIENVSEQMILQSIAMGGGQGRFVRDSFEAVFAPAPMRRKVKAALLDDYEAAHVDAVLGWFESELGRRVREEERKAQDPAAQQELLDFIAAMQQEAPNPERLDLALRLDQGRRASALALNLLSEFMRGVMRGTAAVSTVEGPVPTQDEVDALVNEQIGQLGPVLQDQMVVFYLFMGRNLTLEENRRYVRHVESTAGKWFYQRTGDGLIRAMARAGRAFGIHVAARVEDLRAAEGDGPSESERTRTLEQAQAFAAAHTQAACLGEAASRRRSCADGTCTALSSLFAKTCYEAAGPSASLCRGVPSKSDTEATIFWRADRCEALGTSDAACNGAHGALQDHCAETPAAS